MFRRGSTSLCIAMVAFAWCSPASAETYSDPTGFSITYPDGWVAMSSASLNTAMQSQPDKVRHWLRSANVDLRKIKVMVQRDGDPEGFLENLNVAVTEMQIPVTDKVLQQIKETIPSKFAADGVTLERFQARLGKVGTRDAIFIDYITTLPTGPERLWQRQAIVPGGRKTFTFTCTALADSFPQYEPTFAAMLDSIQVPPPLSQDFDWGSVVWSALLLGILGGLLGGFAAVRRKIVSGAKPD